MLLALAINIFSKSANVNNGRHFEIKFCRQLVQCTVSLVQLCASLQNRRNFLRILGEWRRKGGEREARVAREGKSAPLLARNSRFALASRSPRFRLYSPKCRLTVCNLRARYDCQTGTSCMGVYIIPTRLT